MQILIIERNDITPLLGMDWMKKFNLTIRNIRTDENSQSEKKRVIEKFPNLFKNNTTIKDTEINIQLKPGHYPVKQKARPIPLHLQEEVGKELEKLIKTGHLEKVILLRMWGLEKFRFYLYGKKIFLYTDHQALEPLIKRNRCNRQYSARLTRWLDRLAHFDIAIQHIAGSNLKFTDFLSRNPVENAATEDVYDEQYVINILSEQAELNLKYGSLFVDQSRNASKRNRMNETKSDDQSKHNRTFENNRDVNKNRDQAKFTSNNSREKLKPESKIRNASNVTSKFNFKFKFITTI